MADYLSTRSKSQILKEIFKEICSFPLTGLSGNNGRLLLFSAIIYLHLCQPEIIVPMNIRNVTVYINI
jgi:hypothetical protein